MKTTLRINGSELIVENFRGVDPEFNNAVCEYLRTVYGKDKVFAVNPAKNFRSEEHTDAIFSAVLTGNFESEAPVNIVVADESGPILDVPAFISFRK